MTLNENGFASDLNQLRKSSEFKLILLVCVVLTGNYYLSNFEFWVGLADNWGLDSIQNFFQKNLIEHPNARLHDLLFWIACINTFYLVLPLLYLKVSKSKPSDFGLKLAFNRTDLKLYFVFLAVMIPLVLYFSSTKSFQSRYPFYQPNDLKSLNLNFLFWEIAYCSQFFCLEFFFRGFMVHGLKKRFGLYSVLVMTVPYCMIHYGKPMPEALAAIIAGVVLGLLSYRNGSILLGFFLHVSVAISMDLCALWQEGII